MKKIAGAFLLSIFSVSVLYLSDINFNDFSYQSNLGNAITKNIEVNRKG